MTSLLHGSKKDKCASCGVCMKCPAPTHCKQNHEQEQRKIEFQSDKQLEARSQMILKVGHPGFTRTLEPSWPLHARKSRMTLI